jgi:hypothetical protein
MEKKAQIGERKVLALVRGERNTRSGCSEGGDSGAHVPRIAPT